MKKISMSSLKSFDFKQFAIDHGEKVVVGVVGLFVLYALFGPNVRWMPFTKTPDELATLANSASEQMMQNTWPKKEKESFEKQPDVTHRAEKLMQPVQSNKYAFSVPPFAPLVEPKQKNDEPKWLPPEHAIASPGRVAVVVPIKQELPNQTPAQPDAKVAENSDVPGEFQTRQGETVMRGAPDAKGKLLGPKGFSKGDTKRSEKNKERAAFNKARGNQKKRHKEDDDDTMVARTREAATSKARPLRFASVRAVIPINRQQIMVAKAFHEEVLTRSNVPLRLLDFDLERQRLNTDGTWGAWEEVNRVIARDVLVDAGGADPEVVNPVITNTAVTMPLPPRALGVWDKTVASHPDVEEYNLTEEEIEVYLDVQERIIEAKEKAEAGKPKKKTQELEVVEPTGWSDMVSDMRELGQELQKTESEKKGQTLLDEVTAEANPEKKKEAMIAKIKEGITVEGRLILFRYIDFDVNPGNAYRYRVQVYYNNPNYGLGRDRVMDPNFALGPKRSSGWSEPTNPVVIPEDSRMFLADVSVGRGKEPKANIDMFQWSTDTGTLINSVLATELGQFVGGKTKTEVLDPAKFRYEEREVLFRSNDVLVDVLENPSVSADEHPDLGFAKQLKGNRLDIDSQALLVNQFGELASLDPVSEIEERKKQLQRKQWQDGPYKELIELHRKEKEAEKKAKAEGLEVEAEGFKKRHKDDDKDGGGRSRRKSSGRRNPMMKKAAGAKARTNAGAKQR